MRGILRSAEKLSGWYCNTCFAELTGEEHKYYDDRCEECERAWLDRVERWRAGGKDKTLDEIFPEIWTH